MKNWFIVCVFLLAGLKVSASEFELEIDSFKEVEIVGNFKVNLIPGNSKKIKVVNNSDYEDDRVLANVVGNKLELKLYRDSYAERDIEITIYYSELRSVLVKRGCKVHIDGTLSQDHLELTVESGSEITAKVKCDDLDAHIQAGGYLHLQGKCKVANYSVNAGGSIKAINLLTSESVATVKAGGRVYCNASEKLTVEITAGGSVDYSGDPKQLDKSVSLGGSVRKVE